MSTGKIIEKSKTKSDSWRTPPYFYDPLNAEFNFDFDPCPYNEGEILPENDGLLIEWGERNFVNPPYSIELRTAFIKKAVAESKKGKLCVLLLPVLGTATKLFHDIIIPNLSEPIRFVRRRIKFMRLNDQGEWEGDKSPFHDSMLVIFDGRAAGCSTKNNGG